MMRFPLKLAAVSLALATFLLTGCEEQENDEQPVLRSVRTLQVSPALVGNTRIFSGISQSEQEAQLSFRVPGTIVELPVKVGDKLEKGDVVARLDPATYELQAEQAKASLAQASASERNASSAYERVKGLYENNNAAKTDLDSARAAAESAQAQVRAAEKALQLANLNVQYTRLVATQDCSVARTNVEVNENVNSGTPVVDVDCGSDLKVQVSVPEGLISDVTRGKTVEVVFDAIPGRVFKGTVEEVGVSASGAGSTFPVSVSIINGEASTLRSGLAAEVTITFSNGERLTNIYLPVSAVNKNNSGEFVYIAVPTSDGQAKVELRNVTIGELTERGVTILSGLNADEYVITAGTKVIRPNMTVLLKP